MRKMKVAEQTCHHIRSIFHPFAFEKLIVEFLTSFCQVSSVLAQNGAQTVLSLRRIAELHPFGLGSLRVGSYYLYLIAGIELV